MRVICSGAGLEWECIPWLARGWNAGLVVASDVGAISMLRLVAGNGIFGDRDEGAEGDLRDCLPAETEGWL
jgi:hypothetical protein